MTELTASEATERQRLLDHLRGLGIEAPIVAYPAHTSIEEGKRLRGSMAGTFTKNLLLQDKKGNLYLVTAFEDTVLDLAAFHTRVGGRGRVGFARPSIRQHVLSTRTYSFAILRCHCVSLRSLASGPHAERAGDMLAGAG